MSALAILFVLCLQLCISATPVPRLEDIVETACGLHDLNLALKMAQRLTAIASEGEGKELAGALHAQAALSLILQADVDAAMELHARAKRVDGSVIPPLAQQHLDGRSCGGLGDLFYVSAVMIKQLLDARNKTPSVEYNTTLHEGFTTLVTLTADSGLHGAAEAAMSKALQNRPNDASLLFRAALLTPGVFENDEHLRSTRARLSARIHDLHARTHPPPGHPGALTLDRINEFALSPTFYFVYQGDNDRALLEMLHDSYAAAHPDLHAALLASPAAWRKQQQQHSTEKIRIGFVSAHFRRHSVCKLFCGVITGLDPQAFDVFLFSALQEPNEDSVTASLARHSAVREFVRVGMTTAHTRREVLERRVGILVYLDVGMDPATVVWAASRLAPVQVCLWGHPQTTGLRHMDYFMSSDAYHHIGLGLGPGAGAVVVAGAVAGEGADGAKGWGWFSEQLVRLDSPGISFARPVLSLPPSSSHLEHLVTRPDAFYAALQSLAKGRDLQELIEQKRLGAKILLLPQFTPKLHPALDRVLHGLLKTVPQLLVAVLSPEKRMVWKNTLVNRWKRSVGGRHIQRVVWLPPLSPEEYVVLLAAGDVMLDPFPFGGGVTTLEALAVCTPVVSAAALQSVPALAAGMLRYAAEGDSLLQQLTERWLLPTTPRRVVDNVLVLLNRAKSLQEPSKYEAEALDPESDAQLSLLLPRLRQALCPSPGGGVARLFAENGTHSHSVEEWTRLFQRISADVYLH